MKHAQISESASKEQKRIFEILAKLLDPYKDDSDRSLVVAMAASLDDQLRRVLEKFFDYSNTLAEKVFENNGPLSSFGNKIMIAYGLKFFSERFMIDIKRVKDIR